MNFLFNNMIKDDNNQIIFNVNFFVSNLKNFILLLKNHNYINNNNNFVFDKHIIYENKTNYIETNFIKIKINYYDFEIIVHEIISKPNKNISPNDYDNIYNCNEINKNIKCNFDYKIKIDNVNIIDGSKSIGFKRYVANIMSWNIYEKLINDNKQEKSFNQIKTFLFQIDFGTIIGLHILLHNSIDIDLINKNIFSSSNNNYWYETKQLLLSNKLISNSYLINDDLTNETLYSKYDFYYFVLTHLITVIQNFNIVHFTTLSIKESKNFKINNIIINSIPNKPINYFNQYYKLNKSHYDKFYITDISLTYLYEDNILRPITYNKNYTSFSEDLLYTSLLYKLKKLILPHPFLNITKCSYKLDKKEIIKENKYELIYIFLPLDDVGNNKIFDLMNYSNNAKHDVRSKIQDDEINELKKNIKLNNNNKNLIRSDDLYYDIETSETKLIDTNKIICSIRNKTNTKLYISKYSNSKILFDNFNKIICNKFNNLILLNYENLLVVFNSNTNIKTYHEIICKAKNDKIIKYYNDKYNFYNNSKYKILSSTIKLTYSNNKSINLISEYVLDYTLNFLEIKRISKKITNEIITNTLEKLSIINTQSKDYNLTTLEKDKSYQNKKIINYENKYFKYKLKYLELRKSISQQVSNYKTKAKSNAKYIEESDGLEDSEDLERELAGK